MADYSEDWCMKMATLEGDKEIGAGGGYEFGPWKEKVAAELAALLRIPASEAALYMERTGEVCWREMYDDGLTPTEAADEEFVAAHD